MKRLNGLRALRAGSIVILAVGVAVTQAGCLIAAAAGGAAGAVAYAKGDLEGVVDADVGQTLAATRAAFAELGMPVMSSYATGYEGQVQARVGTENKATVDLKSYGTKSTKVNIRIGTFGDESLSRSIYEKIKANLGSPATRTAG